MTDVCPRCGARYPPGLFAACPRCVLADVVGLTLPEGFELLEEIGRGGMGTVYKARDLRRDRVVAVKVLSRELAEHPEFSKRFEREARTLARLRHPHIVAFHELRREEDSASIVMEYVDGPPLSSRIPMSSQEALGVADQVCDALAYAHRHGLVHRDIKPENILLDGGGQVKVSDFGIAAFVEGSPRRQPLTVTGEVIGTPEYMAPEALAGASPNPRMDVYSLGIVLYELVTGKRPLGYFELPGPPFDQVLRKALAADPARRYPSIEAMRRELNPPIRRDLLPAGDPFAGGDTATERTWLHAVALLQAVALGSALTLLLSGSIRGRPALATLAALALGALAGAWLRRRWHRRALSRAEPDRPVRESDTLFRFGVCAVLIHVAAGALAWQGHAWLLAALPVVERTIELPGLFYFRAACLEAARISRPLDREPWLWLGLLLLELPRLLEVLGRLGFRL